MTQENQTHVKDTAKNVMARNNPLAQGRQLALWIGALIFGAVLGWMNVPFLNQLFNFIATVFTRLFQFIAVPTIALAVITTLSMMGSKEETKRIFKHTITYTLLTTICAAGIGLLLYLWIQPGNLPTEAIGAGVTNVPQNIGKMSYYDHMLSVIPNNILTPFLTGNVLSILLIATAVGLAFAFMPETENTKTLLRGINGAQEVLFALIRALLKVLPIGILAFAAQLSSQLEAGVIVGALGRYTLVIMAGNLTQFFIVLPLFLLIRGLNPVRVMKAMSPALAVALFTKSSAATLPVTMASAHQSLHQPFRSPHLHNHQHEWLCRLYPCYIHFPHAKWRHGTILWNHDCLALHFCLCCHRKRRCTHGLLLPYPVAHERCRRPHRHHGNHPPHLHHHRYD